MYGGRGGKGKEKAQGSEGVSRVKQEGGRKGKEEIGGRRTEGGREIEDAGEGNE